VVKRPLNVCQAPVLPVLFPKLGMTKHKEGDFLLGSEEFSWRGHVIQGLCFERNQSGSELMVDGQAVR
jgi:hypothetical protein